MHNGSVSLCFECVREFFGEHHGAVSAAGTANGHVEISFAFLLILRQGEAYQVGHFVLKFLGVRVAVNEFRHFRIAPIEALEFRDIVRIGKKADIEDQIGIHRQTVLEPERSHCDKQTGARVLSIRRVNRVAHLRNQKGGGIYRMVSAGAGVLEQGAFPPDGGDNIAVRCLVEHRMGGGAFP